MQIPEGMILNKSPLGGSSRDIQAPPHRLVHPGSGPSDWPRFPYGPLCETVAQGAENPIVSRVDYSSEGSLLSEHYTPRKV